MLEDWEERIVEELVSKNKAKTMAEKERLKKKIVEDLVAKAEAETKAAKKKEEQDVIVAKANATRKAPWNGEKSMSEEVAARAEAPPGCFHASMPVKSSEKTPHKKAAAAAKLLPTKSNPKFCSGGALLAVILDVGASHGGAAPNDVVARWAGYGSADRKGFTAAIGRAAAKGLLVRSRCNLFLTEEGREKAEEVKRKQQNTARHLLTFQKKMSEEVATTKAKAAEEEAQRLPKNHLVHPPPGSFPPHYTVEEMWRKQNNLVPGTAPTHHHRSYGHGNGVPAQFQVHVHLHVNNSNGPPVLANGGFQGHSTTTTATSVHPTATSREYYDPRMKFMAAPGNGGGPVPQTPVSTPGPVQQASALAPVGQAPAPSNPSRQRQIQVPHVLMSCLINGVSQALFWQPDGQGFRIDCEKIQAELLDKYFKGAKLSSFLRSLNRWGFKRLPLNHKTISFRHPLFRRDSPYLCNDMNMVPCTGGTAVTATAEARKQVKPNPRAGGQQKTLQPSAFPDPAPGPVLQAPVPVAAVQAPDPSKPGQQKQIRLPHVLMSCLIHGVSQGLLKALFWQPDGQGFSIDCDRIQAEILDKYFKGTKLSDFLRSLNRWGFKRIFYHSENQRTISFIHPLFRRDSPHLCNDMSMVPCTGGTAAAATTEARKQVKPTPRVVIGQQSTLRPGAASASKRSKTSASKRSKEGYGTEEILDPGPHDVLLGRGGLCNNYRGNKKFRELIDEHKHYYGACCKVDKPNVSREVVELWKNLDPPGRFLTRKNGCEDIWIEVPDQQAREKASQSLRDAARAASKTMSAWNAAEQHSQKPPSQHAGPNLMGGGGGLSGRALQRPVCAWNPAEQHSNKPPSQHAGLSFMGGGGGRWGRALQRPMPAWNAAEQHLHKPPTQHADLSLMGGLPPGLDAGRSRSNGTLASSQSSFPDFSPMEGGLPPGFDAGRSGSNGTFNPSHSSLDWQQEKVDVRRPAAKLNGGCSHTAAPKAQLSAANKRRTPWNKENGRNLMAAAAAASSERAPLLGGGPSAARSGSGSDTNLGGHSTANLANELEKCSKMELQTTKEKTKKGGVEIQPMDVLFGCGEQCFDHVGNRIFHNTVSEAAPEYFASSKTLQTEIIATIVRQVGESGGRFLWQDHNNRWCALNKTQSKNKVVRTFHEIGKMQLGKPQSTAGLGGIFSAELAAELEKRSKLEVQTTKEKIPKQPIPVPREVPSDTLGSDIPDVQPSNEVPIDTLDSDILDMHPPTKVENITATSIEDSSTSTTTSRMMEGGNQFSDAEEEDEVVNDKSPSGRSSRIVVAGGSEERAPHQAPKNRMPAPHKEIALAKAPKPDPPGLLTM